MLEAGGCWRYVKTRVLKENLILKEFQLSYISFIRFSLSLGVRSWHPISLLMRSPEESLESPVCWATVWQRHGIGFRHPNCSQHLQPTWPISDRSDIQTSSEKERFGIQRLAHGTRTAAQFLGLASPWQVARNNIPESCPQVPNSGEKLQTNHENPDFELIGMPQ